MELDDWRRGPYHRRAAYYGGLGVLDVATRPAWGATYAGGVAAAYSVYSAVFGGRRSRTSTQLLDALAGPAPQSVVERKPAYTMPYFPRRYAPRRRYGGPARAVGRRRATQLIRRTVFRMAEMKHIETALSSSSFQASAYSQTLVGSTQGTTIATRVGNTIRLKRINLRGYVTCNASAVRDVVRVMVVLDNQPNGAAPTFSGAGGVLQAASVEANYNLDLVSHGMGPQRYRILFDRVIVLNQSIASGTKTAFFKKSWSVDIPVTYTANAGTVADIGSKNVHFFALSTTGTNLASLTGQAQVCYIDA